jgi:ABC-2 type transport system ATP-binding protein
MTGAGLEADRLTKRFGARTAVDDVSFTARPGEVVGLLGRNGAGKTTTIRLLTTVLEPTSGRFAVAGVSGQDLTRVRQLVGVLPESSGYPGNQTGREYLRYHARLFGLARPDAELAAERLLAEVGLDERATSRISTYSRGMRQRLGIARALVNEPAVVFLDEPTLGLDPAGQRQMLRIVSDIANDRGATVVLSTHTLPEVEEVCTTVLILDKGRILVSGTVGEVARTVAAPRSGQVRVPVDFVDRAREALADAGFAVDSDVHIDGLRFSCVDTHSADGLNAALQAVLGAGIPVLSFEVEGARLSDAFLAMTLDGPR